MVHIRLAQFEGPYDLLISLIEEQKLNISELALSQVTEQYLQYIDQLEEKRPEELADFLVIATKLLLHKSRMLLPQFGPQEEEGPSLEEQLRLYKQFVDASKQLSELWLGSERALYRVEPTRKHEGFLPGDELSSEALHASMVQLVHRLAPPKALPQTRIDKAVSMKEKIDRVRTLLKRQKECTFHELLDSAENKTEVIVSFLALLELVKGKTVVLSQEEQFGDIMIYAT